MSSSRCLLVAITSILSAFCFNKSEAQLRAYGGRKTDNNCKTIYLVNPSFDSIYYIGGLDQKNINDCKTFFNDPRKATKKYVINVSKDEGAYLLLLPKDTIAYNIIIPAEQDQKSKELFLFSRYSPSVINTNEDKKRNKQIKKLDGRWMYVAVSE